MSDFIKFCEIVFNPVVFVFAVSNLATMGLQVNISQVLNKMKDVRFLMLFLVWGWIVGPALGYLITMILPLAPPYAAVMLMTSLAPCAPFLALMVEKARGDVIFAGAFIPLATVGTVIFMPLLSPLLIKGMTLSSWALAKPLLLTILIPLLIGTAIRSYASPTADKMFKPVKVIAGLSTLLTILLCILIFGMRIVNTAGSFALLSMTLFMLILGLIAYRLGFGLKQNERSVMSLGMGTRNITAALMGAYAVSDADPRMVAMVIMWTLWSFILARILSPFYGNQAAKTVAGGGA
jgi:BASS family bile acid:Na+ symporter